MNYASSPQHTPLVLLLVIGVFNCFASEDTTAIDLAPFNDSAHHWYDINDEDKIITPLPDQRRFRPSQVREIADNILLYQKTNGGWPKNYDMIAILTREQKEALVRAQTETNTSFDNGATHSQVEYLARAYSIMFDERYKDASVRGIDFILDAQYPNGGFPQFFPEAHGYEKHITFNDGAMIGAMKILNKIAKSDPQYSFLEDARRDRARIAFEKGVQCILNCQIMENGVKSAWCQQHDSEDLRPQNARTFELASICNMESAEIVLFLMSFWNPSQEVVEAVENAVLWFLRVRICCIREKIIEAPAEQFQYHCTNIDKIVEADSTAPPIWPRFSELQTHRPLFCNRNGKPVYSMAEVERERRTGYAWYTYAPQEVLDKYPAWREAVTQMGNVSSSIKRDTSFSVSNEYEKLKKQFPFIRVAKSRLPKNVIAVENLVYATYGHRELLLDLFLPKGGVRQKRPAVILIHGGGWASGDRMQQVPLAHRLAAHGYITATVEYRLSPEAKYPAAVHDLKAVVRWLRAHAGKYDIDPDRIAALGCSAGGHLAAFLGATNGVEKFEGSAGNAEFSSSVQAVVDVDGVLDLTHPSESGKDTNVAKPSVGKRWLGASYKENPLIWIEASPLTHVSSMSAPILFINSSIDRFHAGRDTMIAKLKRFNIARDVHTISNTPHPFWLFHPWFERMVRLTIDFLKRTL
jgi:PelA/Pel-15E family pectate lyase